MGTAGPALIKQKGMIPLRVKECAMERLGAAAWTAMQEQAGPAAGPANLLDIDPVTVTYVDHARIERAQGDTGLFVHLKPVLVWMFVSRERASYISQPAHSARFFQPRDERGGGGGVAHLGA